MTRQKLTTRKKTIGAKALRSTKNQQRMKKIKLKERMLGLKRKEYWESSSLSKKSTKRSLMKLMTSTSINWMIQERKRCKKVVRKRRAKR